MLGLEHLIFLDEKTEKQIYYSMSETTTIQTCKKWSLNEIRVCELLYRGRTEHQKSDSNYTEADVEVERPSVICLC
jgi:hypothetical protein